MKLGKQESVTLHSGSKMPIMGLGTWKLTGDEAVQAVAQALEIGYRMIDTSGDYGNQRQVAQAIKNSGINREDIYLVTKIEQDDNAYQAVLENLGELGTEYADLILIHRPPQHGSGEDLWEGLIKAKDEGLVRDIGVSNYSIDQIEDLVEATEETPVVNQIEWSPFGHSMEMLRYCQENNIIIQAYSPLTRNERLDDSLIKDLADKYERTESEIMIRWNIQHKVVPIVKASSERHLRENINVFDFELSQEDLAKLDSLNEQFSALGPRPQYIG